MVLLCQMVALYGCVFVNLGIRFLFANVVVLEIILS